MAAPVVHPVPDQRRLEDLSRDELLELLEARGEGGIRIDFSGKTNARRLARRVRPRVIRTIKKYSSGSANEQAHSLVIEGDNLQAMATLFRERGQVDLILTDPPYNTGRDWRYNDRWESDPNDPGLGDWVELDDGERHTKWMRFMWPRLQMMKGMLRPGGVLAICIDHRELFRLGAMLDELFREENRLGIINWQKSYAPRNDNTHLSTATEYVLVYARDETRAKTALLDRTEGMDARYTNPDNDPDGPWTGGDPCAGKGPQNPPMVYGIQSPFTGELQWPQDGDCWRSPKRDMRKWLEEWGSEYEEREIHDGKPSKALILKGARIAQNEHGPSGDLTDPVVQESRVRAQERLSGENWPRLIFLKQGDGRARLKRHLRRVKKGVVPMTYWADEDYDQPFVIGATSWEHAESGHSQTGINELDSIVGKGHGFSTVKPLKLMQKIVQLWCPPDGLVMDPFAGSGTTAHAVLLANQDAGLSRRFILIEQGRPDRGDSYTRSLTANRLQRVISGDWASGERPALTGGYRFATLEKKVDADALLSMEREELADTIIASYFDPATRKRDALVMVQGDAGYKYLVAQNSENEGFFLIWNGGKGNTDFTEDAYEICAGEAKKAGLSPRYHVYARLYRYQTTNVVFYQIPDRILMDFGLDLRGEPFHDDSEP